MDKKMDKSRQQLLQEVIEKMITLLKGTHVSASYPFKDCSLSRPQAGILFHVAAAKEALSAKELSEKLHITGGAVTQFLDDLVEKGLIVRERDAKDRRTSRIKLSDSAQTHFAEFKENYFKAISPKFEALTNEELQILLVLIEKIKTNN